MRGRKMELFRIVHIVFYKIKLLEFCLTLNHGIEINLNCITMTIMKVLQK